MCILCYNPTIEYNAVWTITNYSFLQLVWIRQMWCWEKSHCMIPFMTSGIGGLQSSCPWGACGGGSTASASVSWCAGGSGSLTRPALFFDVNYTLICSETPILWLSDVKSWLIWKDPDSGKDWRQEEKGMTEDEMVGWHHWFNGHEFE